MSIDASTKRVDLEGIARRLLEADDAALPIPPVTEELPELSIADAYAIQLVGRGLRQARHERLVGRKVGLTSAAMQEQLGVRQPDFGYLTHGMVLRSSAELPVRGLIAPRVEAEIAFKLRQPLRGAAVTLEEVLAATAEVAPALEVIDSRIADWRITIADTIADNASSGRVVLGRFRPLEGLDLAAVRAELEVGPTGAAAREAAAGRGDAVLGHPAEAVAWLARALFEYDEGIAADEVVLPGAMARALPLMPGDTAVARMEGLGEVTVSMEARA
jgi:2-keto-4-pentenoate hydratase